MNLTNPNIYAASSSDSNVEKSVSLSLGDKVKVRKCIWGKQNYLIMIIKWLAE